MRSLINGKFDTSLDSQDRGFQYGDGLFETLAIDDGEIKYWQLHWQRLSEGCERLFLPLPNEIELLAEIENVLLGIGKEIVKIIISRGIATRGYAFDEISPTRVVSAYDWPELSSDNEKKGVELFVCKTAIAKQPALAGIKHLNRLENILARHEWQDRTIAEGLMLDTDKNVIEGTMSNIFMVKNKQLHTPDLANCGVNGISRHRIMQKAKEKKIPLLIENLSIEEFKSADEVFICNSLIGIWPVKKIDDQNFNVDASNTNGQASNSITRLLQENLF